MRPSPRRVRSATACDAPVVARDDILELLSDAIRPIGSSGDLPNATCDGRKSRVAELASSCGEVTVQHLFFELTRRLELRGLAVTKIVRKHSNDLAFDVFEAIAAVLLRFRNLVGE